MVSRRNRFFSLILLVLFVGCGETGQLNPQRVRQEKPRPETYELLQAAASGSVESAVAILDKRPELIYARNDIGETALSRAVGSLHPNQRLVKLLLERGAKVNIRLSTSETPLHLAASKGHVAIVRPLLDHGAEVNAQTRDGLTPLNLAVRFQHPEAAKLLASRGADVNVFDAAALGQIRKLRHLFNGKPTLARAVDRFGQTPLHIAALWDQVEAAKLLLAYGADPRATDLAGRTPRDIASEFGSGAVQRLLESGRPATQQAR